MNISYDWLKSILPIDLSAKKAAEILTDIGLEVEKTSSFNSVEGGLKGLLIGQVKEVSKHPDADRLNITKVDIGGDEFSTIVCGAPNVAEGQKVVVAVPGTTIHPTSGKPFAIKKAKIRGVSSYGMICAEDEIGLGKEHDGIMVLDNKAAVGQAAANYFNLEDDTIFEIGLTPNRADGMSHYGVARDLLAALKYKKLVPSNTNLKSLPEAKKWSTSSNYSNFKVIVDQEDKCHRYAGLILENISVKESPDWLKNKLKAIGLKPINNVVDTTNFVLHELGQPLHAFDLAEIEGKTIKVRCAKKDQLFTTLDGAERKLHENDLMICNNTTEMCLAGIFGGEKSGVKETTKTVFIESALFDPVSTRKTAKRHGLNTDASFRFERGVDPAMVIPALVMAAEIMEDIAGANVCSQIIDVHPVKHQPITVSINYSNIRKLCGIELSNNEMNSILTLLDIQINKTGENTADLLVPNYRNDVTREADIAEEVLRIYGYNEVELPTKLESSMSFTPSRNAVKLQKRISDHLSSIGLNEILSNSLSKRAHIQAIESTSNLDLQHISLLNPLSNDTAILRQSLVYNLIDVIKTNQNHGEVNCALFEWGKVYQTKNDKFKEQQHLTIGLSGLQNDEHWFNGKSPVSFFQLKGIVQSILELLGLQNYQELTLSSHNIWSEGITINYQKKEIAKIGLLNSELLTKMNLSSSCYIAELNWDAILPYAYKTNTSFQPINKFQKVYRDLSFLITEKVTFHELTHCISKVKNKILQEVSLFDVYRNKKSLPGKKAYGLRFEFLHSERTLTDKEVDKVMKQVQEKITKELNAELR
ncbi:MAG: phenylalanine--tRNA ligase subunit beta [Crocinitomicaceae bacterium]|nr:phenylalanine--tRNA ligase subunit beta [Crocinitomicaceae bacterium]|tara:strand:- start:13444 stop:15891 length:2448 start_codon:yes stop_codon:yes gene_type:complete